MIQHDLTELPKLEQDIVLELMHCEYGCTTTALAYFVLYGDDVDSVSRTLDACASLEKRGIVRGEGLPIMWSLA